MVTAQVLVTMLAAGAALPFGLRAAVSALIGGRVCLVANALAAIWVFRRYRADEAGLAMRFYGAEIAKLALALTLFAVAFLTIESLNLPALFGAYLAAQVLPAVFASSADARSKPER